MSGDMIQRMAVAPAAPHALYGLDKLARAKPDAPVLLVEGERTADAAQKLFPEHVCMAWGHDAQSASRADYSPLRGRNVIIWPVNCGPNRRAAMNVGAILKKVGAYPLLLPLPDSLPTNWNLADAPPDGFDPRAYLGRAGLPPVRLPVATADDAIRPWPVLHPDAFANRFIWVCARRSKLVPCPEPIPDEAFAAFQEKLWERIRLAQSRSEIRFQPMPRRSGTEPTRKSPKTGPARAVTSRPGARRIVCASP